MNLIPSHELYLVMLVVICVHQDLQLQLVAKWIRNEDELVLLYCRPLDIPGKATLTKSVSAIHPHRQCRTPAAGQAVCYILHSIIESDWV